MENEILLSIIVPTKDRYEYLQSLLKLFCSTKSNTVELVIQDNSIDNAEFISFTRDLEDKRVRYFYSSESLSIIENCDIAVENARGAYICFIGDDDGFAPWLIDVSVWMLKNSVDIVYSRTCSYKWPDFNAVYNFGNNAGSLQIEHYSGKLSIKSSESELIRVLRAGGTKMFYLPRLYHGIVSKMVLNRIQAETGTYFPGPSPDMANAVAICIAASDYAFIDFPLIISGHGNKSGGGKGAAKMHHGKLSEMAHLPKNTEHHWNNEIPKFWSGSTIWAQSVIRSLTLMNRSDYLIYFNFPMLYASCLMYNNNYASEIQSTISTYLLQNRKGKVMFGIKLFLSFVRVFGMRFNSLLKNLITKSGISNRGTTRFKNVPNIEEAAKILEIKFGNLPKEWEP